MKLSENPFLDLELIRDEILEGFVLLQILRKPFLQNKKIELKLYCLAVCVFCDG